MKTLYISIISGLLLLSSCTKQPGPGGTATIQGKVYSKYYNKTFSAKVSESYAPKIDVYIIYGDQPSYGSRAKTAYDGTYQFRFLEKGSYKVYAYSRDTTGLSKNQTNQYLPNVAIIKNAEIQKSGETVDLTDINIIQ